MKLERLSKKLLTISFFIFLFCVGTFFVLSPDRQISAAEYRTLEQQPNMTVKNLINGTYVKDFEGYFTDQFPGRNFWLKKYLDLQRLSGKTYLNRYYVAPDGWIIPEPRYGYSKELVRQAITNLNRLAENAAKEGVEVFYVSAPHRINAIEPNFPDYIQEGISRDKKEYFLSLVSKEYLKVLDLEQSFKAKYSQAELKQMYFKTDHHWNAQGSFNGYQEIRNFLSSNSQHFTDQQKEYKTIDYKSNLLGSYNRHIHYLVNLDTDRVSQILPKDKSFEKFKISVNGKASSFKDLYGSAINKKNQLVYAEIFTGDLKEIKIYNSDVKASRLLIVKDSFANPIIFHIAQHFQETVVFDIRHNTDSLRDFLNEEKQFDTILFLYNDTNLGGPLFEFEKAPKQ